MNVYEYSIIAAFFLQFAAVLVYTGKLIQRVSTLEHTVRKLEENLSSLTALLIKHTR